MTWNSKKFNLDTPEEKIIEEIQDNITIDLNKNSEGAKAIIVNYLLNLINIKKQNKFNKKLLASNRKLVYATWAVAIATIFTTVLILIFK